MVVTILGEGRGRVAMLVQLNAPAIEFDLVQPLLAAPSDHGQVGRNRCFCASEKRQVLFANTTGRQEDDAKLGIAETARPALRSNGERSVSLARVGRRFAADSAARIMSDVLVMALNRRLHPSKIDLTLERQVERQLYAE